MSDQAIEEDVDLSAFPLLRIDQIHRHTTQTLIDAEAQLISDELELPFVQKLLSSVQHELSSRREGKQSLPPSLPSTSSLVKRSANANTYNQQQSPTRRAIVSSSLQSPTKRSVVSSSPTATTTIRNQQHQQPSFFVSNSPNNNAKPTSNFRSRAKLAKASLQARSNEANLQELEQKRINRTREALETMQDWRLERERSKKLREELLKEEREQRRQRWRERKEREARVRDEMQVAAEEAKSKALELGRTNDEAVVEAAAAAAKVVDDESIVFVDDDTSVVDDDCSFCTTDIDDRDNTVLNQNDEDVVSQGCTAVDEAVDSLSLLEESTKSTSGEDENDTQSCASSDTEHETTTVLEDDPSIVDAREEEESESSSSCSYDIEEDKDDNEETAKKEDSVCDEISSSLINPSNEDITSSDQQQSTPPVHEVPLSSSSSLSISISQNEHLEQKTSISYEHKIPREETKSTKINKFCNIFSSFQDIFTNSSQRQKVSADVKHRELSKSMQHQVTQLTRARSQFVNIKCSTNDASDSDSSLEEEDEADVVDAFDQGLFYRINSRRPEVASIIETAFSSAQLSAWEELPSDIDDSCWNLMWVWGLPKAADFDNLLVFQKINRFRNTRGLTRKDLLKKNIQQYSNRSKDGDSFNIMPLTYALPHEFNSFVSGYQSIQKVSGNKSSNIWIIKPVGLSRGRGISLVNDLSAVSYSQPIVIQRYIADPLCFKGFKFDLRIYVLVTSFNPLEAFIYKEGLARFGSRQYSARPESLNDHRIHLTNSSLFVSENDVDRSHPAYLAGSNGSGNKVAFTWLWKRLEELGMDTKAMWCQMVDICHKALVAAGSDIPHQPNSFEIFGFDLMFDQSLKCWLIEVNSSPSLGCDSSLDTRIKGSLIRDSISLVAPPLYDRKALSDICNRRLTHRKSASTVSCKDILESDLSKILKNRTPRQFGEKPRRLGNFERLVPD